jgi:hypothetical protein
MPAVVFAGPPVDQGLQEGLHLCGVPHSVLGSCVLDLGAHEDAKACRWKSGLPTCTGTAVVQVRVRVRNSQTENVGDRSERIDLSTF